MRRNRGMLAVIGSMAIALAAVAPGLAEALRVSETAKGGVVPPAIANPNGPVDPVPFVQKFRFKGKKLSRAQILDINVTVSAFGNAPNSNGDLALLLVDPRGDVDQAVDPKGGSVLFPVPSIGNAMQKLRFDDKSLLIPCNPFNPPEITNCNFLQGGDADGDTGTMTGNINASITSSFENSKPRGTWKLIWREGDSDDVLSTIGRSRVTLKVKPRR